MPHTTLSDTVMRRPRGPEEIVLDAWLEDAGPYVKLETPSTKWKAATKYVEHGRARSYDPSAV